MFKKINRLTKDKDFDNVFKKGRSSYNKILGIKTLVNNLTYCRFGILVSTKISKKAVERNKIKRRVRDIITKQTDNLKLGYDIIIIALPEIINKEYCDIKKSILYNFKKVNLYK